MRLCLKEAHEQELYSVEVPTVRTEILRQVLPHLLLVMRLSLWVPVSGHKCLEGQFVCHTCFKMVDCVLLEKQ